MTSHQKEQVNVAVKARYPLARSSLEKLFFLLRGRELLCGELLLKSGTGNDKEYFLLSGILRSFVYTTAGGEVTLSFYTAPAVITPCAARTQRGLSVLNIQAITDADLAVMDASRFARLRRSDSEINRFAQSVIEWELQRKTEKEISLASLTARERLLLLRKNIPGLENSVPHGYIASYLGITTVSLSRLRKELAGQ